MAMNGKLRELGIPVDARSRAAFNLGPKQAIPVVEHIEVFDRLDVLEREDLAKAIEDAVNMSGDISLKSPTGKLINSQRRYNEISQDENVYVVFYEGSSLALVTTMKKSAGSDLAKKQFTPTQIIAVLKTDIAHERFIKQPEL